MTDRAGRRGPEGRTGPVDGTPSGRRTGSQPDAASSGGADESGPPTENLFLANTPATGSGYAYLPGSPTGAPAGGEHAAGTGNPTAGGYASPGAPPAETAESGLSPSGDSSPTGDERIDPDQDVSLRLPRPLVAVLERRRREWRPADTLAAAVTGANVVALLLLLVPGSLYIDDLRAQGYAQGQPFLSFILGSNGTHFAPLPRTLDWVQATTFPLEDGPAVVISLVLRVLMAMAFWRLLRRLFGPRLVTVVPLAVLLFTPALLQGTAWYRQWITVGACTVAMIWALDAHIRWCLRRRRIDLMAVVVATVLGVCTYEKAAAIPVILIGASVALFAGARRRAGVAPRPFLAGLSSVLLSGGVVAGFVLIYRSGPYDQGSQTLSLFDVLRLAWETLYHAIIPMLLGGPWHWFYPSPYVGVSAVSTAGILTAWAVIGLLVLVALIQAPGRVIRSLVLTAAWVLPSVGIVAYGRYEDMQLVLATATRLWIDVAAVVILGLALAVLPWRIGARVPVTPPDRRVDGAFRSAAGSQVLHGTVVERPAAAGALATRAPVPADVVPVPADVVPVPADVVPVPADVVPVRQRHAGPPGRQVDITLGGIVAVVVALVVAGGTVTSWWTFADKWHDNPTGAWIANARADLAAAEPYPRILATPLPNDVMPAWVTTVFPSDAPLILLLRPDARFHDGDGPVRSLDGAGHLVAPVAQTELAKSAPAKLCAAIIPVGATEGARVPLTKPSVYAAGAQVEVGLLLGESTRVDVTVETADGQVIAPQRFDDEILPKGPHRLNFPVPVGKSVSAVRVRTAATAVGCVPFARVWVPVNYPTTASKSATP